MKITLVVNRQLNHIHPNLLSSLILLTPECGHGVMGTSQYRAILCMILCLGGRIGSTQCKAVQQSSKRGRRSSWIVIFGSVFDNKVNERVLNSTPSPTKLTNVSPLHRHIQVRKIVARSVWVFYRSVMFNESQLLIRI